MKQNKINVIDLDKTLIPYDSFRKLVYKEIKKGDIYVFGFSVFRKIKIISSYQFKKKLSFYFLNKYDHIYFKNFANKVYENINPKVLDIIDSKTDKNTKNILISASPNLYVKYVIEKLKWEGMGSFFKEEKFINLYSDKKIEWLKEHYPQNEYYFNFAISDSQSDKKLLSLFKEYLLWHPNENK